ncbi:MAG TPA: hypothetical protein VG325_19720 [Solirubrobacteraceae bacterium]|nr:hypothetical protein [Solirubrobacteraceae bacterium]
MLAPAVTFASFILAVHILAAVVGFGIVFAFPVLFAVAGRTDPGVIPWLLRARQSAGRYLVNPGLLVVVLAGIYLASDEHQWSRFYVGWGIIAAIVIGAIEGAVVIRRAGALATLAERDLAATAVPAGGRRTSATWSPEYATGLRRFSTAGNVMALIVVVTVFLMATHAGA